MKSTDWRHQAGDLAKRSLENARRRCYRLVSRSVGRSVPLSCSAELLEEILDFFLAQTFRYRGRFINADLFGESYPRGVASRM